MKGQRKQRLREREAQENRFGLLLVAAVVSLVGMMVWGVSRVAPIFSPTRMVAAQVHDTRKPVPASFRSVDYGGLDLDSAQYPNYQSISFAKLSSYPFNVTEDMFDPRSDTGPDSRKVAQQIPGAIQALSDKKVAVTGFMLPVQLKGKFTTEFLLLQNRSTCCYGVVPQINEWIIARAQGKNTKPLMDVPVTALGTFHVGEQRENGELAGIYELDCDKVILPNK